MAQYNKQNLLLNQRKIKLNTKEIEDLYEIKIMEKFHPPSLHFLVECSGSLYLSRRNGRKVSQWEGNMLVFFDFFVKNVY